MIFHQNWRCYRDTFARTWGKPSIDNPRRTDPARSLVKRWVAYWARTCEFLANPKQSNSLINMRNFHAHCIDSYWWWSFWNDSFLDRKSEYSYGYGGVTKRGFGSVYPWITTPYMIHLLSIIVNSHLKLHSFGWVTEDILNIFKQFCFFSRSTELLPTKSCALLQREKLDMALFDGRTSAVVLFVQEACSS